MIIRYAIATLMIFSSVVTFAQTEQEILPSERKQLTIITEPFTLYKGFFRGGVALQYSSLYKIFDAEGNRVPISNASGRTWVSQFIMQYGISDRLQIDVALPYVTQDLFLSYHGEAPGLDLFEQQKLEGQGSGLGDVWMGVDYQLLTETSTRPSFKGLLTVTLPTCAKNPVDTGDPEVFDITVGSGYYSLDAALSVRKITYPFSWSAYASYKMNSSGTKQYEVGGTDIDFKDGNLLTLSGSYNFHMNEWLALTHDIYYFHSGTDEEDGKQLEDTASWLVQYSPRLSFQINRLRVNQAIQIPLFGKMSGADPGFILIVQYVF